MNNVIKSIVYSNENHELIKSVIDKFGLSVKVWELDQINSLKKDIRDFYRKEQRVLCAYCKSQVSVVYPTNCHIEHIAPKSLYPNYMFEPKNLCVICADCNQIKRNQETINEVRDPVKNKYKRKYPVKSEDFLIVHPHFDNYEDHILIVNGYYIDKGSRKGNFTIGACLLNRKLLVTGWEPVIVNDNELINDFTEYIDEKDFHKRALKLETIKNKLFN